MPEQGGLNAGNADGRIDFSAGTGAHAEFVGADEAAGLAHGIVAGNRFDCFPKITAPGMADKFLRVAVNRAGIHAGARFTVEAALKFGLKFCFAQVEMRIVRHFFIPNNSIHKLYNLCPAARSQVFCVRR